MNKPITQEMIDALYGLKVGITYVLRGDKSLGLVVYRDPTRKKSNEKNCRSLAPLMRRGFVEFSDAVTDMSRFYRVRITARGEEKLRRTSISHN